MIGFAAPDVRASLGIDLKDWGLISGITLMGVMASFVFLFFADRVGRARGDDADRGRLHARERRDALATDAVQFTALQLVARPSSPPSTPSRSS